MHCGNERRGVILVTFVTALERGTVCYLDAQRQQWTSQRFFTGRRVCRESQSDKEIERCAGLTLSLSPSETESEGQSDAESDSKPEIQKT